MDLFLVREREGRREREIEADLEWSMPQMFLLISLARIRAGESGSVQVHSPAAVGGADAGARGLEAGDAGEVDSGAGAFRASPPLDDSGVAFVVSVASLVGETVSVLLSREPQASTGLAFLSWASVAGLTTRWAGHRFKRGNVCSSSPSSDPPASEAVGAANDVDTPGGL
jgi:hypothetical protein